MGCWPVGIGGQQHLVDAEGAVCVARCHLEDDVTSLMIDASGSGHGQRLEQAVADPIAMRDVKGFDKRTIVSDNNERASELT